MTKSIVIVVSAMNLGGAQRVVALLCNYLVARGHRVTLITTFTDSKVQNYKLDEGVIVRNVTDSPLFKKVSTVNLGWKLLHLRDLIRRSEPSVVVSFLARVNVATAMASIGVRCSHIICERTWPPFASLHPRPRWFYRFLFRRAQKIIVQTELSRSWLAERFPESEVKVIPNPAIYPVPVTAGAKIHPFHLVSHDRKVILASGRLHAHKQFHLVIMAFSYIASKFSDWDLVILGEGEEREALSNLVQSYGLEDRVFFPGNVGNVSEWYERAELFVLSSVVEGFPNVLLEAMVYGVACISFDCNTGPRDMIEHGVNGFLVDPDERESGIFAAMYLLISNDGLRREISENCTVVRERYAMSRVMQEWNEVLDV